MDGRVVYETGRQDAVSIIYTKRADAPERGCVFSAKVVLKKGNKDYTVGAIKNYTGYFKKKLR